jgi:hypothetical protein
MFKTSKKMKQYIIIFLILIGTTANAQIETIGTHEGIRYDILFNVNEDYDIVKTDREGNVIDQISEFNNNNVDTTKESYIVFGYTNIINNKITSQPSDYDYWLVLKDIFEYELYPNPTKDIIFLFTTETNVIFELYDLRGQRIFKETINNHFTNLNLGFLSQNIYTYRIINQNNQIKKIGKICVL